MNKLFGLFALLIFAAAIGVSAQTADASLKPAVITGDVVSISQAKILIKTKDGDVEGVFSPKTEFKRVPPENPSLKNAVPAVLTDISGGDRVMATGVLSADRKSFPARAVYLMTKSDISQKQAKEAEQWRTRGIAGRVAAVNPETNQITVEIRSLVGSATTTLTPKSEAVFKRYAPDSIKFNEAKVSSIGEVKQGDMIRALGDRSADGTSFSAEQIVSGAFQTIAGPVKSVDPQKNEVIITDLQTKKDVTVSLGAASLMKRFPAEMAERLAGGAMGGNGGIRPPGQGQPGGQSQPRPGGQEQPGTGNPGQGRPGIGGQRGGGGIDEMLDRFPSIAANDIKVGDMIAVSSTKNGNTQRINAIKLLAGVEPFIRLAQMTSGGGGRGQGGQGVQGGFTIPGLDGIGFP